MKKERQYSVYVSCDESGASYIDPDPRSEHFSLAAAIRAARKYGRTQSCDGAQILNVAHIERHSDGAKLHPWADPVRGWYMLE